MSAKASKRATARRRKAQKDDVRRRKDWAIAGMICMNMRSGDSIAVMRRMADMKDRGFSSGRIADIEFAVKTIVKTKTMTVRV